MNEMNALTLTNNNLRWLKTDSSTFQDEDYDGLL